MPLPPSVFSVSFSQSTLKWIAPPASCPFLFALSLVPHEYPEVLGSILGALKAIVNVIGMTKMTPHQGPAAAPHAHPQESREEVRTGGTPSQPSWSPHCILKHPHCILKHATRRCAPGHSWSIPRGLCTD